MYRLGISIVLRKRGELRTYSQKSCRCIAVSRATQESPRECAWQIHLGVARAFAHQHRQRSLHTTAVHPLVMAPMSLVYLPDKRASQGSAHMHNECRRLSRDTARWGEVAASLRKFSHNSVQSENFKSASPGLQVMARKLVVTSRIALAKSNSKPIGGVLTKAGHLFEEKR